MRIAIDARELAGKPTGVGRYLSQILSAWTKLPGATAHEFILCSPDEHSDAGWAPLTVSRLSASGHGTMWEQLVLPGLIRQARKRSIVPHQRCQPRIGEILTSGLKHC